MSAANVTIARDNDSKITKRRDGKPTAKEYAVGLVIVAACLGVGGLGAIFTSSSVSTWYLTLAKPAWNPPGWVFGPVWTTLYVMMGVAYWLVWRVRGANTRRATVLFVGQLVLNLAWSALFFGLQRPDLALLEIVVLLTAITFTAIEFRRHSPLAANLFCPYIIWVAYATSLNAAIACMNA